MYSDSAYVVNAFLHGWLKEWQANNWRTKSKKDVSNRDLWEQLLSFSEIHNITFHKVKGHSDNKFNNLCDALARAEIKKII